MQMSVPIYHGVSSEDRILSPSPAMAAFLLNMAEQVAKRIASSIQEKSQGDRCSLASAVGTLLMFFSDAELRLAVDVQVDASQILTYDSQEKKDHS